MSQQVSILNTANRRILRIEIFFFLRYIGVILPREEGKPAIEVSPKKIKKAKALARAGQVTLTHFETNIL